MTTIILVSCVSKKGRHPAPAEALYASDWFCKARAYARAQGAPWFILSAEYGLLPPGRVVAPYNKTLNTMPRGERERWARGVLKDLARAVPGLTGVVFLAGARYREFLAPALAARGVGVSVPMAGLGIGRQLAWLAGGGGGKPPKVSLGIRAGGRR